MRLIGIICDFLMSVMFYGTLYALLGYVYAQGKQVGRASAIAPVTETPDTAGRGESVCVASVDVLADGYAVKVCIRPHVPERGKVRRGQKFSSFFRKL